MTDAVTPFHSQLPVRIAFGDGVIAELPDTLRALGATGALVVVEEPVAGHADVVSALAAAEDAGVRLERFVKGPGEPTFALADELGMEPTETHDGVPLVRPPLRVDGERPEIRRAPPGLDEHGEAIRAWLKAP